MREIKFRAYDCDNDEMIYSLSMNFCNSSLISIFDLPVSAEKVELMQYTGLKDKNGVEIYEGDIVNIRGGAFYQGYWEINEVFEVFYNKCGFFLKKKEHKESFWIAEEIYVLGNIYENQKLLKD